VIRVAGTRRRRNVGSMLTTWSLSVRIAVATLAVANEHPRGLAPQAVQRMHVLCHNQILRHASSASCLHRSFWRPLNAGDRQCDGGELCGAAFLVWAWSANDPSPGPEPQLGFQDFRTTRTPAGTSGAAWTDGDGRAGLGSGPRRDCLGANAAHSSDGARFMTNKQGKSTRVTKARAKKSCLPLLLAPAPGRSC
jgi:hypothetical protein